MRHPGHVRPRTPAHISFSRADVHSYTKKTNDRDGNGYITYHG